MSCAPQGVRRDPRSEEEPGRILHEHRTLDDPHRVCRSELGVSVLWRRRHTPQWVNLLVAYCDHEGDAILDTPIVDRLGRHLPLLNSLLAALDWIVGRLDDPAGGSLWVRRATPSGIANQVWEDSVDSYYHADGKIFDFARPLGRSRPGVRV